MLRKLGLIIGCWLIIANPAMAKISLEQFPYYKPLVRETKTDKEFAVFAFDDSLYAHTDKHYVDLRVVDQDNQEIPFFRRQQMREKTEAREYQIEIEILKFKELSQNRIEVIIKTKKTTLIPQALIIHTNQKNYEKQVTIYGSYDQRNWQPITEAQPIFDYSRFIDVSNHRVELTPPIYRYYKLEISNIIETYHSPLSRIIQETKDDAIFQQKTMRTIRQENLRIDEITMLGTQKQVVSRKPITQAYTIDCCRIEEDIDHNRTYVYFTSHRQPLTAITIETSTANFSRTAVLHGTNTITAENTHWQETVTCQLTKINLANYIQENLIIHFPAQRYQYYRLVIENQDSPPLDIIAMTAEGLIMEGVFILEDEKTYRLFYGAERMTAPQYDIQAVISKIDTIDAEPLVVGNEAKNLVYQKQPTTEKKEPLFSQELLFTIAIVLMVVILTLAITGVAKKIEESEE